MSMNKKRNFYKKFYNMCKFLKDFDDDKSRPLKQLIYIFFITLFETYIIYIISRKAINLININ